MDLGPGITVTSVNVSCPTCLTAQVTIAANAPVGPHNLTVTTGTEVATLLNGFTVQAGTPLITALNHASIQQGQTESLTIAGQLTHFAQGTTQIDLGAGITVTAMTVASPTSVTAQITADVAAAVGTRTLTVTTGTGGGGLTNVFSVTAGTPSSPHLVRDLDNKVNRTSRLLLQARSLILSRGPPRRVSVLGLRWCHSRLQLYKRYSRGEY